MGRHLQAEIDCAAGNGWSPLQWAAAAGHAPIVSALAAAGARIPAAAKHLAEAKGHSAVAELLGQLEAGKAGRGIALDSAMASLQRAKAAEAAGHEKEAVGLYTDGLTVLVEYVQLEPDLAARKELSAVASSMMAAAERLKKQNLDEQEPTAGANDSAADEVTAVRSCFWRRVQSLAVAARPCPMAMSNLEVSKILTSSVELQALAALDALDDVPGLPAPGGGGAGGAGAAAAAAAAAAGSSPGGKVPVADDAFEARFAALQETTASPLSSLLATTVPQEPGSEDGPSVEDDFLARFAALREVSGVVASAVKPKEEAAAEEASVHEDPPNLPVGTAISCICGIALCLIALAFETGQSHYFTQLLIMDCVSILTPLPGLRSCARCYQNL